LKSILSRRPSAALVIACIALFVSLGGVSYGVATGFIDSREIKDNTIRSRDVRNNTLRTFDVRNNEVRGFDIRNSSVQGRDVAFDTLTGDDVSEEDLGKVPTAGTADTATTAGSVGGVSMAKIAFSAAQGMAFVEILNLGGLRLEARCGAGGALEVRGNPTAVNSEIVAEFPSAGTPTVSDPDFDPGDNVVLADDDGGGSIAFAGADGAVVTIQAVALEQLNDIRGTTDDCGFFGVAQAG
jgi:hypothetical protein